MRKAKLSGFGIGALVVLCVAMVIRKYTLLPDEPVHIRILQGLYAFVLSALYGGLIMLALFIAVYMAIRLAGVIYDNEETDDQLLDHFMALAKPLIIICFIASYVIVFLN